MLTYILLVLGFVILIKGADLLVDGASSVAAIMNVSPMVIGLTVVAFGTSTPELVVNVLASAKGNTEIAIGNILGSNIANIFLILGISAIIYPLAVQRNTVYKEIPYSLLAAVVLGFMANDLLIDGAGVSALTRSDGLVLLSFFILFIYYVVELARESNNQDNEAIKTMTISKSIVFIILGLAGLLVGGQWIIQGAVTIAEQFNLSQSLIGLTIVAIGTSLPEMATSIVAARKKNVDIAVGNIIGSNIFNILFVLGVSALVRPLPFLPSSSIDILMTELASILLFVFLFIKRQHVLKRWHGIMFVIIYVSYLIYLGIRG